MTLLVRTAAGRSTHFSFICALVSLLNFALRSSSQTFDIAGPDEYTYREIVEYVFEQIKTPYPEVRRPMPYRDRIDTLLYARAYPYGF